MFGQEANRAKKHTEGSKKASENVGGKTIQVTWKKERKEKFSFQRQENYSLRSILVVAETDVYSSVFKASVKRRLGDALASGRPPMARRRTCLTHRRKASALDPRASESSA